MNKLFNIFMLIMDDPSWLNIGGMCMWNCDAIMLSGGITVQQHLDINLPLSFILYISNNISGPEGADIYIDTHDIERYSCS